MKVFVIALHFGNAMKTGCWHTYSGPGRVGVSRSVPRRTAAGYRRYPDLYPGPWFKSVDWTEYQRRYAHQLACLDPTAVWADLHRLAAPYEPVLLCWESAFDPTAHCHRWLVAEWIGTHLGVIVAEADPSFAQALRSPSQVQLSLF